MGKLCHISLLEYRMLSFFNDYQSPIGKMTIQVNDQGLMGVWFSTQKTIPKILGVKSESNALIIETQSQLNDYFKDLRREFNLPLFLQGTLFQQQAWQALRKIPFGETRSYLQQAQSIHKPKAVRAIGSANAKNPISIIVPCHRVIAANGALTGHAGGLELKLWLLDHEKAFSVCVIASLF